MNPPMRPVLWVPSTHLLDARKVNAPTVVSSSIAATVAISASRSIPLRVVTVSVIGPS